MAIDTSKWKKEADVKKAVKAILDKYDWFWWMPAADVYGSSGVSDFNAIWSGVFMVIETKFGSNKPTALQIGYMNSIRNADGFAFVVNEKNIDWLEAFLDSFALATQRQRKSLEVPQEHGAQMLNAIAELSNKFLDTAPDKASVESPPVAG